MEGNRYERYELEDFLRDDEFIRWVRSPDPGSDFFWKSWQRTHPGKVDVLAQARAVILSTRYRNRYEPDEAGMERVWEGIQAGTSGTQDSDAGYQAILRSVWRYAAVIVVVSFAGIWLWKILAVKPAEPARVVREGPVLMQRSTARGERMTVVLPDGSRVKLNSESRIAYDSTFGKATRDVVLEGEAFFEVKPDKNKPFNIRTGKLTTTVLGTSFNISAYGESPKISVAVLSGKVKVTGQSEKAGTPEMQVLLANEMAVYRKTSGDIVKNEIPAETERIFAWKDETLVLKDAGYPEIKETLERWYGVTFVEENGLGVREEFSARFKNVSIEKVLDALNYTSRFRYEIVRDTVYVTRKPNE